MRARSLTLVVLLSLLVCKIAVNKSLAISPAWVGQGSYRLLIDVNPVDIGTRTSDERPAQLTIDWPSLLQSQFGISAKADLNSVQIIEYDAATGQPIANGDWAYGKSSADRAFRWYDNDIPNPYPEVESYLDSTSNGTLTVTNRPNWGYFLDTEGSWSSGRLAWSHVQNGNQTSHYAVYFNTMPSTTVPYQPSPRGFLGDGNMRTEQVGYTTTGALENHIDMTDWDGDGLVDIVAGNLRGGIAVYKNLGTPTAPVFGTSKLVTTTDGKPIDIGWDATPRVIDFDGDGVDDIVTGGQLNRLVWYKNVGTNTNRQFQYKGVVSDANNQVLALPTTPNPERPTITADYYPVIDMVDLNGDGRKDLIAGGYITGRLYYYLNTGVKADGTPKFVSQGPLIADGAPIDTEWAAAPTFADFNGDGLLDIVTGTFAINSGVTSDKFLNYYVNVGTATQPVFQQRPVPKTGQFPAAALAAPRAVDFNGDGLLDLAVSSDEQIYLYPNTGTKTSPSWAAGTPALPSSWGSAPLFATQFIDWNHDGHLDKVQGLNVSLNLNRGNPGVYGSPTSVLPPGQSIPPKPGMGDGWQYLRLYDLNWDGNIDIMDADWDGKIWLHRNRGTNASPNFDTTGVVCMQLNGQPIDVGPGPNDSSFDQLQGSRASYTVADFNRNGRPDLVVVNFAGKVTYYENEMAAQTDNPLFTLPTLVGQLGARGVPFAADWNGDGLLDILASADPGKMLFIQNAGNDVGGRATFLPGVWINLPDAPYGSAGLNILDFNGDGDADVLVDTTHRYTVLSDGSFIKYGYATGNLTGVERFSASSGDFNHDGRVDAADYIVWRSSLGLSVPAGSGADADGDGIIGPGDYAVWRANFGTTAAHAAVAVPEACPLALLIGLAIPTAAARKWRRF